MAKVIYWFLALLGLLGLCWLNALVFGPYSPWHIVTGFVIGWIYGSVASQVYMELFP